MKIVIPVANEHINRSLPWAIRTIRQHTDLEPITVGGKDYGLCTHFNTQESRSTTAGKFDGERRALSTALNRLQESFVWSSDDIYWLEPAKPVRWAIGDLRDDLGPSIYQRRKATTAATLAALGASTVDFESHTPLPIVDLDTMVTALTLDGAIRSLYGNLTGPPDITAPDVKLRLRTDPLPQAPWASTAYPPNHYPQLWKHLRG